MDYMTFFFLVCLFTLAIFVVSMRISCALIRLGLEIIDSSKYLQKKFGLID